MRSRHVHYELSDGFIHNWLVAGPQAIPVRPEQYPGENFEQQIMHQFYQPASGITATPVERGPLDKGLFTIGDYTGSWCYYRCREDHTIDQSGIYPTWHFLRSWAYIQVMSKTEQEVALGLAVHGPVDVWMNRLHVSRWEPAGEKSPISPTPHSISLNVMLKAGENPLLVRFETAGVRECRHSLSVRVCEAGANPAVPATGVHVRFPTLIPSLERREKFEAISETVYLTRDVYMGETPIQACWPATNPVNSYADVLFQTPTGRTYAQAEVDGTPGDKLFLGYPFHSPQGPRQALIMPRIWEFAERGMRITRKIPCWTMGLQLYSGEPAGDFPRRRLEALTAAARLEDSVYAEIAKMALGTWAEVDPKVIRAAIEAANQRLDGSILDLLGLLVLFYRFSEAPEFPAGLDEALKACILGYPYEPGDPSRDGMDYLSESSRILFPACEILAGQRYPDEIFQVSGQTGAQQRARGEKLVLAWIAEHAAWGFADWGSPDTVERSLAALFQLADFAEAQPVWELAAVMVDKLLFGLALNSYKGVYSTPHRRGTALGVKGGYLAVTAGICRLAFGMGIYNQHAAATVSLACADQYELPLLIPAIAADRPEELWGQAQQANPAGAGNPMNQVIYKTPDYLLCSAQDYAPGTAGGREHLWQVTLGPEAVVFTNHPGGATENEARWPNYWLGNTRLPRIAQWKDALIALYNLPAEDWMGFTHAYFPALTFDEYVLRAGWAFGRKGNGYVAVTNSQGFNFIQQGLYAYRELRSFGRQQVWLCQMGRAAQDGDFTAFQEKVLALPVAYAGLAVGFTTLRGDTLAFDWENTLRLNGVEQILSCFKHFDNRYAHTELPCREMVIQYGEDGLRLNFHVGQTGQDVS